jgi:hypothetical protein
MNHPKKFRKKPVVIEALLYDGSDESIADVAEFVGKTLNIRQRKLSIHTLEGTMEANPGDWIIKGVKGEFYPCKPDIFEATYEAQ